MPATAGPRAALGGSDQARRHRIEIAPVEELRQRVVHRLDGQLRLQCLDLDHLVREIGIEPRELLVQPLHFQTLRERAVALEARVLELVLDAQQVILRARTVRQPLRLRHQQLPRAVVSGLEIAGVRVALRETQPRLAFAGQVAMALRRFRGCQEAAQSRRIASRASATTASAQRLCTSLKPPGKSAWIARAVSAHRAASSMRPCRAQISAPIDM